MGSVSRGDKESIDRWTVDTDADLELVTKILEELYPEVPNFHMQDVFDMLDRHPEMRKINSHIPQKPVRKKS